MRAAGDCGEIVAACTTLDIQCLECRGCGGGRELLEPVAQGGVLHGGLAQVQAGEGGEAGGVAQGGELDYVLELGVGGREVEGAEGGEGLGDVGQDGGGGEGGGGVVEGQGRDGGDGHKKVVPVLLFWPVLGKELQALEVRHGGQVRQLGVEGCRAAQAGEGGETGEVEHAAGPAVDVDAAVGAEGREGG